MKLGDTKSFERIPVIYGIQNTITQKWYIGSCLDMKDRFERHRYYLRHNQHHSTKLQRAYNKDGEEAFEVYVLYNLRKDEDRFVTEQSYIESYNSVKDGYNMLERCIYVDNFRLSDEARNNFLSYIKTLQKAVIAIDRFTGEIEHTFESITEAASYYHTSSSNISRACKGIFRYIKDKVFIYSEDFDITKDYKVLYNHNKGKLKPIEQKIKIRHSKKCKPIYKYDAQGNFICEYFSISEAARQNNTTKDFLRYRINTGKEVDGFLYYKNKHY